LARKLIYHINLRANRFADTAAGQLGVRWTLRAEEKKAEVTNEPGYSSHTIFAATEKFIQFYKDYSFGVFTFSTLGTKAVYNIDSYLFSSMQGTLDSIRQVLLLGRINDAYALLRKLHDAVVVNICADLFLQDNIGEENLLVPQVNEWFLGNKKLPEFRIMSQYIRDSSRLKALNELLYKDDRYKRIRENCNDHVHYNSFDIVLANDSEILNRNRIALLDQFLLDIQDVVVLHLSYSFFINGHYMMASDYMDSLELGMTPEEGSQYLVAPYVQEIFDTVMVRFRPDIAELIKKESHMQIE
jgi:hypothetical protein